jgi:large subunit ribosomal protein LP1
MNKLSKSQQDEFATAFAILALYDGGADVTADQINGLLTATGNTEVEPFYPIIFANFLNSPEKISKLIAVPSAGGGGGGGGGGAAAGDDAGAGAAPAKVEEKEEEEEVDMAGGMDMFGGEEGGGGGGGGGDY